MPEMKDMVDSALEFMLMSCDQYETDGLGLERRLKHATINLYTGIELLLKARLAREHWTLVLSSADRYQQGDWERGSFLSVSIRDAMARLSEVCRVNLSQQAETAFVDLGDLRNKFLHFAAQATAERVTGIQLRAWHYAMDLMEHDFLQISETQAASLGTIRNRMQRREELLVSRFEQVRSEIEERIEAGADVIVCPFCGHRALSVGDGARCLVCGSPNDEAHDYAEEYARRAAPWMSSDEYYNTQWAAICSECGRQACVVAPEELKTRCEEAVMETRRADRDPEFEIEPWYCFNCAEAYDSLDVVECTRCGQLFARHGTESLCPSCSW